MVRRLTGLVLAMLGAWIAFQALQWAVQFMNAGALTGEALTATQFLIPFMYGVSAMIGGILALLAWRGGVWFGWIAALISSIYPIGLIVSGREQALWLVPLMMTGMFLICSLVLSLRPRNL